MGSSDVSGIDSDLWISCQYPIRLAKTERGGFDLETVTFWSLKNATSIAETVIIGVIPPFLPNGMRVISAYNRKLPQHLDNFQASISGFL